MQIIQLIIQIVYPLVFNSINQCCFKYTQMVPNFLFLFHLDMNFNLQIIFCKAYCVQSWKCLCSVIVDGSFLIMLSAILLYSCLNGDPIYPQTVLPPIGTEGTPSGKFLLSVLVSVCWLLRYFLTLNLYLQKYCMV